MSGCLEDLRGMIAGGARRIPGVAWLLAWRDPLHLARRLLARAVLQRTHHVRGCLLDLGCGGKPYRSMFQNVERYIGLDVQRSANVDVVGNGMRFPFYWPTCFSPGSFLTSVSVHWVIRSTMCWWRENRVNNQLGDL